MSFLYKVALPPDITEPLVQACLPDPVERKARSFLELAHKAQPGIKTRGELALDIFKSMPVIRETILNGSEANTQNFEFVRQAGYKLMARQDGDTFGQALSFTDGIKHPRRREAAEDFRQNVAPLAYKIALACALKDDEAGFAAGTRKIQSEFQANMADIGNDTDYSHALLKTREQAVQWDNDLEASLSPDEKEYASRLMDRYANDKDKAAGILAELVHRNAPVYTKPVPNDEALAQISHAEALLPVYNGLAGMDKTAGYFRQGVNDMVSSSVKNYILNARPVYLNGMEHEGMILEERRKRIPALTDTKILSAPEMAVKKQIMRHRGISPGMIFERQLTDPCSTDVFDYELAVLNRNRAPKP